MRPPKLRPSRSICRRVMAFWILSNNDRLPFWILKILIFDHMTVIVVLTCCCVPNFIKIGSRIRPPGAHDCIMFNASLLGNGRRHGNRIIADMSGTWWDVCLCCIVLTCVAWRNCVINFTIFLCIIFMHVFYHNERNIPVCCKFTRLHFRQILLKSVNIWLSYCEKQKGELFLKQCRY